MLSQRRLLTLAFLSMFMVAMLTPVLAQRHRGGQRGHSVQRSAPRMQRSAPRVQRSAPRMQRSAPRMQRSSPRSQMTRTTSPQRHQVTRQARPQNQVNRVTRGQNSRIQNRVTRGTDRRINSQGVTRGLDRNRVTRGAQSRQNLSLTRPMRHTNFNSDVTRNANAIRNTTVVRNVNSNVNRNYYTNRNVYVNRRYVVNSRPYWGPGFYNSPFLYNDYAFRRGFRRFPTCASAFLGLGFFMARPYSAFDYAWPGYNYPIFYGDEAYYRAPARVDDAGGPEADAITAEGPVATAEPKLDTPEEQMLAQLATYVEGLSVDGRFQLTDSAFGNEIWKLELAQAPAVFEIQDGFYSVVAGFEGTLGDRNIPSNVSVEFFLAKTETGYEVRESWISSANGIARDKLFQSPVYPEVKTWEEGQNCPFSKQPMVPIPPAAEHG